MKVKIRYWEDAEANDFTEIHFSEVDALIAWVNRSHGVYVPGQALEDFHSYQIVSGREEDGTGAYLEIVIGREDQSR